MGSPGRTGRDVGDADGASLPTPAHDSDEEVTYRVSVPLAMWEVRNTRRLRSHGAAIKLSSQQPSVARGRKLLLCSRQAACNTCTPSKIRNIPSALPLACP